MTGLRGCHSDAQQRNPGGGVPVGDRVAQLVAGNQELEVLHGGELDERGPAELLTIT
jgi:hypothetical protein